ncbi:rhomboid family intramembrane serine protease [Asticcacaulis solisilvae]|uniref:rhomboid family intramembrane serine protease n=1 Tax=Asticcacaulis solisilvae TaxID=1217274 RepID=UPI003FD7A565
MTDRDDRQEDWRPAREPFFTAPPLVVLFPVVLVALYALQSWAAPDMQMQILDGFALSPTLLRAGYYDLLVTHIFLHGSWLHVLANSAFCLAFAAPLVRAMGRGIGGAASYIVFFLLCGIAGGLGYCALNWHSSVPVVGASGAISGLVGAAIRLRSQPGEPDMKPLWHPRVLSMTAVWLGMNVLTAFVRLPVGEGMVVAWQAHVAGYLFGLVVISPWMRLFHRHYFQT